jgi:hypothetical protein
VAAGMRTQSRFRHCSNSGDKASRRRPSCRLQTRATRLHERVRMAIHRRHEQAGWGIRDRRCRFHARGAEMVRRTHDSHKARGRRATFRGRPAKELATETNAPNVPPGAKALASHIPRRTL